jgi:hypothetical protein
MTPLAMASLMPFSTPRMNWRGIHAAHDAVFEDKASAARHGFHFDPAIAELAASAGLLLVAALDAGLALDGFLVRHPGFLQLHLHANLRLFFSRVDSMWTWPMRKHVLLGLEASFQAKGHVLFNGPVQGREQLFLVALGLGLKWQ